MDNLLQERLGTCSVCAGHSDGQCYCESLTPCQTTHYYQDYISIQQTNNINQTNQQNNSKAEKKDSKRPKKDNTEHKKFITQLKQVYKHLFKKLILTEYHKDNYHRKDYFLILLSQIEWEGKTEQVYTQFKSQMKKYLSKIQDDTTLEEKNKSYTIELIRAHLIAFDQLNHGHLNAAMRNLYGFDKMKHINKFKQAFTHVMTIRAEMGLPIEEYKD